MKSDLVDLFMVYGEDSFLVEQAVTRLVSRISAALGSDILVETIDCSEAEVESIIAEVLSPSLFARKRITILKHLSLTGKSRLNRMIENMLSEGIPQGQFLIIVPERIDKRLKVSKLLERKAEVYELPRLGHEGLVEWIMGRFRELDKVSNRNVAEMLLDLKGEDDTRVIDSEIEKIVTYVGNRRRIEVGDVESVTGKTSTEHVFDLIRKVASHDVAGALETLGSLLMIGESPIGIVYLLTREVKSLLQVHLFLKDTGIKIRSDLDYSSFAQTILPSFREWVEDSHLPQRDTFIHQKAYAIYRRFVEASGFSLSELVDLLDALIEINVDLVSTSMDARILIENFIISLGACEKMT